MDTEMITLPKYVLSFGIAFCSFLNAFQDLREDYKSWKFIEFPSASHIVVVLMLVIFLVDEIFPRKPCFQLLKYKTPTGWEIWRLLTYTLLNYNWYTLYHCLQMHMLLGRPIEILLGWQAYVAVYLLAALLGTPFPTFVGAYSTIFVIRLIYPTYAVLNIVEISVNLLCMFLEHLIILRDAGEDELFPVWIIYFLGLSLGYISIGGVLLSNVINITYAKMSLLKPFIKIHTYHFLMYRLNHIFDVFYPKYLRFAILFTTAFAAVSCMAYKDGRTKNVALV